MVNKMQLDLDSGLKEVKNKAKQKQISSNPSEVKCTSILHTLREKNSIQVSMLLVRADRNPIPSALNNKWN